MRVSSGAPHGMSLVPAGDGISGGDGTSSGGGNDTTGGGDDTTSGGNDTTGGGNDTTDGGDDTTGGGDDTTDGGGNDTLVGDQLEDLDERDGPTSFDVLSEAPDGAVLEAVGPLGVSSPVAAIDQGDLSVSIQDGQILVALGDDFALLDRGQQASVLIPYQVLLPDGSRSSATLTVLVDGEEGTEGDDELILDEPGETIRGGGGNDLYIVDDEFDDPVEAPEGGIDTVRTRIDWDLGDNLENLELDGDADLKGSGNALANQLLGNAGRNSLEGLAGNDTLAGLAGDDTLDGSIGADLMRGGAGDDTYFVDNSADRVEEEAETADLPRLLSAPREPELGTGAGIDTVITQISYTLGANLENLRLVDSSAATARNGAGNGQDNALIGNAANNTLAGRGGNDTLDGGAGQDLLLGGSGNDVYRVTPGDITTESAGGGTDSVQSSSDWTLAPHIENLELAGTSGLTGNGNGIGNTILGNAGGNLLRGLGGSDTLRGGAGDDVLVGGGGRDLLLGDAGADVFVFAGRPGSGNVDTIGDFDLSLDLLRFDRSAFPTLTVGTLQESRFVSGPGAVALDPMDRILYDTTTGSLYYDPDGSGDRAASLVAILGQTEHPELDFELIVIVS